MFVYWAVSADGCMVLCKAQHQLSGEKCHLKAVHHSTNRQRAPDGNLALSPLLNFTLICTKKNHNSCFHNYHLITRRLPAFVEMLLTIGREVEMER